MRRHYCQSEIPVFLRSCEFRRRPHICRPSYRFSLSLSPLAFTLLFYILPLFYCESVIFEPVSVLNRMLRRFYSTIDTLLSRMRTNDRGKEREKERTLSSLLNRSTMNAPVSSPLAALSGSIFPVFIHTSPHACARTQV